jgi:hypothetical protein
MNCQTRCRALAFAALVPVVVAATAVNAAPDYTFSGQVRLDTVFSTTDRENMVNQRGNIYNGVPVTRTPPAGSGLVPDVVMRNGQPADNDFNVQQLRSELDMGINFSADWRIIAKLRAVYDLGKYSNFDPAAVDSQAAGFNYGKPNFFEYDDFEKGGSQNPLEIAGRNYMVDLPALYVDYQSGPLNIRAGNQQIAWGQALFFRVLDVPNGLDLRRHLFLDYAPEEYADERISALGVRAMYQLSPAWEMDSFVQKFQPTIYPNANTPYNAIASQFTVQDQYRDVRNKLNYGVRLRGSAGDVGLQFIAAQRYNPDGVFRWTESGVNRDIPGMDGTGALLAMTPLEVDPTGVWSGEEWFAYAGNARLDGVEGLNSMIREFEAAQMLGGYEVENVEQAKEQLDLFFQLAGGAMLGQSSGGLRGHLAREYFRETILGGGMSYIFQGAPGSITDQLILNIETTYTPKRRFTNPSLSRNYIEENEWVAAFVLEKYQRFSIDFPATYLVFQGLHKTRSDLYGRHLDGNRGDAGQRPQGSSGGFNALVFAAQQPFPNLIWRADLSVLYDLSGGVFVQPALRWQPRGHIRVETYFNYVDGSLGSQPNDNIMQTIRYANELGLRMGYQF